MKSIYEFLLKNKTVASTQGMGYVDLGLPSGLLWARCNIGAYEPYEYGDYFMWGSTEPDTDKRCDWKNCPFNNDNDNDNDGYDFNKDYFKSIKDKVCPNGILAPEYDPATVILGDDWRLPTADEFKELIDNTEQEWVKNYQDSKINGILFQTNDAELFIPASGFRCWSSFYDRGRYTYLWSSLFDTSSPNCAMAIYLDNSYRYMCSGGRPNGYCLRGVKK